MSKIDKKEIHSTLQFNHILLFIISILGISAINLTLLGLLYYGYWKILAIYCVIIYFDPRTNNGTNRINPFRNFWAFELIRDYFQMKLIVESELDSQKNYIMCYHPHSILPWGMVAGLSSNVCGLDDKLPGISVHTMGHSGFLQYPILREICLYAGLNPVTKPAIKRVLNLGPGHSSLICIGGVAEMFFAKPGLNKLVLNNRFGFIRMALETGSDLVPIFGFGENETYDQIDSGLTSGWVFKLRAKFYNWSTIWFPVPYARGISPNSIGVFPNKAPITIIVGKPIEVTKIPNPSEEEIRKLHEEYCDSLKDLYNRNIAKYWYNSELPHPKLEIVDNPLKLA